MMNYAGLSKSDVQTTMKNVFGEQQSETPLTRAALREINLLVLGSMVHPCFASPRLQSRTTARTSPGDGASAGYLGGESQNLSGGSQNLRGGRPRRLPDADSAPEQTGGKPNEHARGDGTLAVKHPPELARRPSLRHITCLTAVCATPAAGTGHWRPNTVCPSLRASSTMCVRITLNRPPPRWRICRIPPRRRRRRSSSRQPNYVRNCACGSRRILRSCGSGRCSSGRERRQRNVLRRQRPPRRKQQ